MKAKIPARLRLTAFHEAGHAVVGLFCGIGIRYVTILPDDDCLGHVMYHHPRWWRGQWAHRVPFPRRLSAVRHRYYESYCVACYAGPCAASKLSGCSPDLGARMDKGHSRNAAQLLALSVMLQHAGDTGIVVIAEAHARYFECVARHAVKRCWPAVKAVAAALLENETLRGCDVKRIASPLMATERRCK